MWIELGRVIKEHFHHHLLGTMGRKRKTKKHSPSFLSPLLFTHTLSLYMYIHIYIHTHTHICMCMCVRTCAYIPQNFT